MFSNVFSHVFSNVFSDCRLRNVFRIALGSLLAVEVVTASFDSLRYTGTSTPVLTAATAETADTWFCEPPPPFQTLKT